MEDDCSKDLYNVSSLSAHRPLYHRTNPESIVFLISHSSHHRRNTTMHHKKVEGLLGPLTLLMTPPPPLSFPTQPWLPHNLIFCLCPPPSPIPHPATSPLFNSTEMHWCNPAPDQEYKVNRALSFHTGHLFSGTTYLSAPSSFSGL